MLKECGGIHKVYIACGRTDLRKGIDSLAARIGNEFSLNPFEEGTLFLFCGNRKDRIKGLLYEGDGYLLLYKRLTDGRFQWPNSPQEARELSKEEYRMLLEGFSIEKTIRKYTPKRL